MTVREKFKRMIASLTMWDGGYKKHYEDKYLTCDYCNEHFRNQYHLEENSAVSWYNFWRCEECNRLHWWISRKHPITIWRVMRAFGKKLNIDNREQAFFDKTWVIIDEDTLAYRILTNENWSECIDDDQSDEVIEKLFKLNTSKPPMER